MALIVDCSVSKTECYLFDPMERMDLYKMPAFVIQLQELSYFKDIKIIFGNQSKTMDCFHRTIDYIARFVDGVIYLNENCASNEMIKKRTSYFPLPKVSGRAHMELFLNRDNSTAPHHTSGCAKKFSFFSYWRTALLHIYINI